MTPLRAEYQLGPTALDMLRKINGPLVPERQQGRRVRTVLVPVDLALVYDGTGWRFGEVPPRWWLEMTEPEVADAPESACAGSVVTRIRRTSCRPGRGPCRRRHEHASSRRAA